MQNELYYAFGMSEAEGEFVALVKQEDWDNGDQFAQFPTGDYEFQELMKELCLVEFIESWYSMAYTGLTFNRDVVETRLKKAGMVYNPAMEVEVKEIVEEEGY